MGIITTIGSLLTGKGGDIVKNALQGADNLFTSKGEMAEIEAKLTQEVNRHLETVSAQLVKEIELENANTADARKMNIDIQTSDKVPMIVKLRPTIIAFFVSLVWGCMTIYIIGTMLHVISRDPNTNFEAVMAMYAGLNILFGNILNFDFGSSAGSQAKSQQLNKIANAK